jgi:hypothetical protein
MKNKRLRDDIYAKVKEWLGRPTILHFWRFDDTFVVLARVDGGSDVYCLRIFPVGDSLALSQDNVIYDE